MGISFGTKAETLDSLANVIENASVLPQVKFTAASWAAEPECILQRILMEEWGAKDLIVRSSAADEDGSGRSLAGHYLSVPGVRGAEELCIAIERVIESFGNGNGSDQVFVQPLLGSVSICGVAFSCDPNTNAPYIVLNIDRSGSTSAVTAGSTNDLETYYCYRNSIHELPEDLRQIGELTLELMEILDCNSIDLEFAVVEDEVYLLQVRPLATSNSSTCHTLDSCLRSVAAKISQGICRHPYLHGDRTIFGVMPDWNPAEIIGIRPRPLALSLYKDLVTDSIWAYQRHNYGYRNLRSFPLVVDFCGLPYVDVRLSFNSFIPADIHGELADRLVNHYVDRLAANPSQHDKVEFEIVHSCFTLDLPERLNQLSRFGFSKNDQLQLTHSLRQLTNRIINNKEGLWLEDSARIKELETRYETIRTSKLDKVSRIYWLLEDCKRYGTLPFAGLARAAFIAVQFLRSMVNVGILDREEMASFLNSLATVSSRLAIDSQRLRRSAFLEEYGHLRPGTYDITSPRYDEAPEKYFDWEAHDEHVAAHSSHVSENKDFSLSLRQLSALEKQLQEHGLEHGVLSLFAFLKNAIEGREYSKFVFTRSLSLCLSLIRELGEDHGFSVDDCSYLDICSVRNLYSSGSDIPDSLKRSIEQGKERFEQSKQLLLPPLISSPNDVYCFCLSNSEPNYITLGKVSAPVRSIDDPHDLLKGGILFIPSADPGFDWIFSHRIAGLVTMYGGANSHMAIRAGELGVPAIIGAGSQNFEQWQTAEVLEIDCMNRQVRVQRSRTQHSYGLRAA